ncbi:MAG: DUF1471 domain-containing protein [Prosthecobacter sp.]
MLPRSILSAAVLLAVCLMLTACPRSTPPPPPVVLRLAIMRDGSITTDGSQTSLEDLPAKLKDLAAKKGIVYYYREVGPAPEQPHPNALKVINALKEHQLPVSVSSKPDFSDEVTPDGRSHPR